MTTQIAVRLPDEIVEFVDQQVAKGTAPSRAAVVARALEREMRRQMAERDIKIYAAMQSNEFDGLAAQSANRPMDID